MDKEMVGMCGTYCGDCDWREKTNCPGCQKASCNMFWGECLVALCSIAKGSILSLGPYVKVISPQRIADEIIRRVKKSLEFS